MSDRSDVVGMDDCLIRLGDPNRLRLLVEDAHVRMLLHVSLAHSQHTRAVHPEREGG